MTRSMLYVCVFLLVYYTLVVGAQRFCSGARVGLHAAVPPARNIEEKVPPDIMPRYFIAILLTCSPFLLAKADDEVKALPGFDGEICFKNFAGYLPTDVQNGGKNLFYWYHESVKSPSTKPIILWLNGGPGCSSLGGMFGELGPFVVSGDQRLA